jgi:hypothetical protein
MRWKKRKRKYQRMTERRREFEYEIGRKQSWVEGERIMYAQAISRQIYVMNIILTLSIVLYLLLGKKRWPDGLWKITALTKMSRTPQCRMHQRWRCPRPQERIDFVRRRHASGSRSSSQIARRGRRRERKRLTMVGIACACWTLAGGLKSRVDKT